MMPGDADGLDLPETVFGDAGLSLTIWRPTDADSLRAALAASDAAFRDWLPGVLDDTRDVDAFLREVREQFNAGSAFVYAVIVEDQVVGQCSLNPSGGQAAVVGYWVRTDRTDEGFATAALQVLTSAALGHGYERLELRCDEGNVRSAAVARRAEYRHLKTVDVPGQRTLAQTGREMIWERHRT